MIKVTRYSNFHDLKSAPNSIPLSRPSEELLAEFREFMELAHKNTLRNRPKSKNSNKRKKSGKKRD